jgi:hypothetical protein
MQCGNETYVIYSNDEKERDYLNGIGIDGKLILKLVLNK